MICMGQKIEKTRYVTEERFEKSMTAIMQSFVSLEERMDAKFDRIMNFMSSQFQIVHEELRAMNKSIQDTNIHLSRHDRQLHNHESRIEKIENTIE